MKTKQAMHHIPIDWYRDKNGIRSHILDSVFSQLRKKVDEEYKQFDKIITDMEVGK
jgi:hypothetical protein